MLPLLGAAFVGMFGSRALKDQSHWPILAGVGASLGCAILLFARAGHEAADFELYRWMNTGASWLHVSFRFDALTSLMLLTVTAVAFLVVVYSVGYMRDHHGHAERGYERFFACLGIFVFSMCTLVLAGNFVVLYLGWELVGLSSYLLIGFYYQKPEAAAAAKKAFIVTRIGDFGFGLGILLIILTFGSADYTTVFDMVRHGVTDDNSALTMGRVTTIALLLFCGAIGKSAQLPLHVWLPDAMEGPTPVSALIHAATMVTAGVYMVARCHIIFAASDYAMWIVGSIGAVTAIFAATIALTQFDMKRILAYSTLSQLGFMFLGLGVGAFDSAMFHLFTHAFFKALLFLGAGSVMHAMAGTIDIRRFSGLRRSLPITYWTFLIGGLALAGFPLLSGFWSKDEILHAALHSDMPWLGWIGVATALLTAFYTFRMIFIAFHGPERLPRGVEHAHESGPWMSTPLVVLSIGAVAAGYLGVHLHGGGAFGLFEPTGRFHSFLHPVFADLHHVEHINTEHQSSGQSQYWLMYLSAFVSLWGIATAAYFYLRRPVIPMAIALASGPVYQLLYNKYYVDELYDRVFVQPLRRLGQFCYGVDRYFINGILWLITAIPRSIGYFLKGWQQGAIQGYALGMVVGILVMVWWMIQHN
jgi:NADH-quinone oxidoreductase subunit L